MELHRLNIKDRSMKYIYREGARDEQNAKLGLPATQRLLSACSLLWHIVQDQALRCHERKNKTSTFSSDSPRLGQEGWEKTVTHILIKQNVIFLSCNAFVIAALPVRGIDYEIYSPLLL